MVQYTELKGRGRGWLSRSRHEVKGLIAFYGTPLGKKSIQVMPALMNECLKAGQEWGQGIIPNLMPRLEARLKQEGFSGQ